MNFGKVTGKVVSTQKDPGLVGHRLLVVQFLDLRSLKTRADYVVAVDTVGADEGDCVLVVAGSSARFATGLRDQPVDSSIVAIVDTLLIEGDVRYSKRREAALS